MFDQILLFVDSPVVAVLGKLYSKIWSKEVEDHFWSELLFEYGVSALLEASNNHRIAQPRWCLVGTEGPLWIRGGDPASWKAELILRTSRACTEEKARTSPCRAVRRILPKFRESRASRGASSRTADRCFTGYENY